MLDVRKLIGSVALGVAVLGAGGWAQPEEPATIPAPEAAEPGTFETLDDGSLLIEGRIKVLGKGTKEKPFVVDWAVLTSAMRMYDPRADKNELPAWTEALEGKRVRLTGYLLLPMTGTGAEELLIMQNQWDGCCIGVPPTPYDAVEVRMAKELDTTRGAPGYGALEGTFKTDPYIVSGWLLGLYMLEDAGLVKASDGGT
ncbi:MAG: hypothetical protein RIB60_07115 [Phycisphaerales bacterium]